MATRNVRNVVAAANGNVWWTTNITKVVTSIVKKSSTKIRHYEDINRMPNFKKQFIKINDKDSYLVWMPNSMHCTH